jgi:hypothetical protein
VWVIGVDLVPGAKTLHLIKEFGLSGETLFAGLVDAVTSRPMTWLSLSLLLKSFRKLLEKVKSSSNPFYECV